MKNGFLVHQKYKSSHRRAHGDEFEKKAQEYLRSKSYQIIANNVRYSFGEIDIVSELRQGKNLTLVFVEVRKRDSRSWLTPEETLTFPKQRSLRLAIQCYLARYSGQASEVRIDLIAFRNEALEHFEDFIRF